LKVDPKASVWVREAVDRVLQQDHSLREILREWEARGVPTAREHQARETPPKPGEVPKDPPSYRWNISSLKRILLSPALLGYATAGGEIMREDGLPVKYAEPLVSADEALELRKVIQGRGAARRGIRSNRSPLLGVVWCACGVAMNYQRAPGPKSEAREEYRYYRCGRVAGGSHNQVGVKCPAGGYSWPLDILESYLEGLFLDELGGQEIQRRKFVPGLNRSPEIASLRED